MNAERTFARRRVDVREPRRSSSNDRCDSDDGRKFGGLRTPRGFPGRSPCAGPLRLAAIMRDERAVQWEGEAAEAVGACSLAGRNAGHEGATRAARQLLPLLLLLLLLLHLLLLLVPSSPSEPT